MTDPNCIFCKISQKEIPANIINENDLSISFLDINPVSEGHVLIIPKDHHPYLTETPDQIVSSLFLKAKELMPAIKQATQCDFVALTVIGTDIPHFHIHLIPRFKKDGLAGFWPAKKYESTEKMSEIAEKIKIELS